ncbi:uncharacterized protein LOC132728304 [Ruditapes philippinarum]|uniref:uncharacterized protein LOC132723560 n=1 Tax=Ruditapes philippinarum TaxID=129788 RepID=UPI00295B813F|nr:uncharacterized protein LOC132723560 [Ruditapes philippinarum]XP_060569924.1 uncharacterized protein LOC132728304 [Ruditapes philippinarum]
MNFSAALVFLACLVAYVSCEVCTTNTDCGNTRCAAGLTVICQHPDGSGIVANGGLCTCEQTAGGECTGKADCYGDQAPNLTCPDSARHCYDNKCICDRFPISGGRK